MGKVGVVEPRGVEDTSPAAAEAFEDVAADAITKIARPPRTLHLAAAEPPVAGIPQRVTETRH